MAFRSITNGAEGHCTMVAGLYGRESEIETLAALVAGIRECGSSLVIRGDPGVGKTALLEAVGRQASELGWMALHTAGTPSESQLPMAALHKLIRPVMVTVDRLRPAQRNAIQGAFGLLETSAPEMFRVALAVLDLLAEIASSRPLVALVDDVHWMDRSSVEILEFVARRLESEPIVLVAATRPSDDDHFAASAATQMLLGPLSDAASVELLDSLGIESSLHTRQAVLDAAAGNPLALLELPKSLRSEDVESDLVPMTERLELAFAARASTLSAKTRHLLLLAALNDSSSVAEILAAEAIVGSANANIDDFGPAASIGLIEIDQATVRFRHPLVRSAIYQSASFGQRNSGHAALAQVLADQPDRQVWHRAASTVGTSDAIASELEEAAFRAENRGTLPAVIHALERAAALSSSPDARGRRLVRAAELAYETGRISLSERLLDQATTITFEVTDRLRLESVRELADAEMQGGVARIDALIALADEARGINDVDLAARFLLRAATRCWHLDFGAEVEARVIAAADQLPLSELDPRRLVIQAYGSPLERGSQVIRLLERRPPRRNDDAKDLLLLGHAAACTGSFAEAEIYCAAAAAGLREQGRLPSLCQALSLLAWAALRRGRWHVAGPAAEECVRLADDTRQPIVQVAGLAAQAMLASIRGDEEMSAQLCGQAEALGIVNGVSVGLAVTQTARAMAAAGAGRPAEAFDHLRRLYQVTDPAHQRMQACWAIGSFAEVAAQCGQREEATIELNKLEPMATKTSSEGVHVAMRYARAVLAGPDHAEGAFRAALDADLTDWPFEHGRLLLAYGRWLRRQRRVTESRAPLRAACEHFDRTGALPWAAAARSELRAAGESKVDAEPRAWDNLSPREMQIALLVAEGLGNKEIGHRMFLSHRTVSSHLYRMFIKLDVTSRGQLAHIISSATSV